MQTAANFIGIHKRFVFILFLHQKALRLLPAVLKVKKKKKNYNNSYVYDMILCN